MARRKSQKRGKRGRRIGGVIPKKYNTDTMLMGGVVVGMLAARVVPGIITKIAPGVNPKVINGIQAAGGVLLATMTGKMPFMRGASIGVGAMGAIDLLTNMGWLPNESAVAGDEMVLSLSGDGYRYGPGPTNYVAGGGGLGANFNNRTFASNLIAGAFGM